MRFLVDEKEANARLLGTQKGKNMTPDERKDYLRPYVLTSILRTQLLNLHEENEGINIILKQASKKVKKDKFSALEYALLYIKWEEDRKKKKKKRSFADFMFLT